MNRSLSAFDGFNLFRFSVYIALAALNNLSELTELGGALKYFSASFNNIGYFSRFFFHQIIGSSFLGIRDSARYLSSSFLCSVLIFFNLLLKESSAIPCKGLDFLLLPGSLTSLQLLLSLSPSFVLFTISSKHSQISSCISLLND